MLTAAKNQLRVSALSIKYNLMREMTNHASFIISVIFMMLNNATFIIQWIILFSIRSDFGGYRMKQVMLLWAIACSSYGIAHILFNKAFTISDSIMKGQLDSFLVQPKNVLISLITSETNTSSIGDLLYGIVVVLIVCPEKIGIYFLFSIFSAISFTAIAIQFGSFAFWIVRSDVIADYVISSMIHFSTYPADGIFKGVTKLILYTIVPVEFVNYMPLRLILHFNFEEFLYVLLFSVGITTIAIVTFYRGLRHYSSTNLMCGRIN
ncbi:MAG: ABC-2 family transporter protein [Clostridiales bacterium]|nr:ABC-2 family transporter protein [Clostridiales bacterium]